MKRLAINTFKDSEKSFLQALDDENINYSKVVEFTKEPMASGNKYGIFIDHLNIKLNPFHSLAKVIVRWIEARASRQVIMTLENHGTFMAKGYSVKEVEEILGKAVSISVIDSEKDDLT